MDLKEITAGIGSSDALRKAAAKAGLDPNQAESALHGVLERVTSGQSLDGVTQALAGKLGTSPDQIQAFLPSIIGLVQGHAANANAGVESTLSGLLGSLQALPAGSLLSGFDANKDGSLADDALNAVKGLLDGNKDGSIADDALGLIKGVLSGGKG
jgi:hypothetical protein